MSNPERVGSYSETKPEQGLEQGLCLRGLLLEVEARYNGEVDLTADLPLIDLMTKMGVEVDERAGERAYSCEKSGCETYCVVAIKPDESEKPFSIPDPRQLNSCIERS